MTEPNGKRLPGVHCPHCRARSIVRTSVQVTDLVRELRLRCENDECGHSFVAQLAVIRTVVPSRRPNPDVLLPLSNPNLSHPRPRPDNDAAPLPANDDEDAPAVAHDNMTG